MFKDFTQLGVLPTPPIHVIDDATSLVAARDARQQALLNSNAILGETRTKLAERLKPEASGLSATELELASEQTRQRVEEIAGEVLAELQQRGLAGRGPVIPKVMAARLIGELMDWQFGAGPLEPLFRESDVEDIIVNSASSSDGHAVIEVWTYRQSGKRREAIEISTDDVREIINRNAGNQGRALNPTTPILNAQMRYGNARGARINAVLNPVCDPAISVTIRIHRPVARSLADLVNLGTLSPAAAAWLWLVVQAGLAIVVGGATSSGKTNLLNAIAREMPNHLRVVCIEDTRELDLSAQDKAYLVTLHQTDGTRAINQRQLVANALRMRPDRIILGEVRDGAAWDAIKAARTGHDGTLLSIHADSADDVLARLQQLCGEAPETMNMSEKTQKEVIASAFQCIVFLERRRQPDGAYHRFVTQIHEVNGFVNAGMPQQLPLFEMRDGQLVWTGHWPHRRMLDRISQAGFGEQDVQAVLAGQLRPWEARHDVD